MQDRGVLVIGDDVVVGHFLFALPAGGQVGHMRRIFGAALLEHAPGRGMAKGAQIGGAAHAGQLIGSLDGPVEVQPRQELRRIPGGLCGACACAGGSG